MNIDTSKLTSEECFKIYNKFNKTIESKIKKLDFNFTDMNKRGINAHINSKRYC